MACGGCCGEKIRARCSRAQQASVAAVCGNHSSSLRIKGHMAGGGCPSGAGRRRGDGEGPIGRSEGCVFLRTRDADLPIVKI